MIKLMGMAVRANPISFRKKILDSKLKYLSTNPTIYWKLCQPVPGYGHWAIYHNKSNEFIVLCGLNKHSVEQREVNHISYRFAVKQQGKGYATEAIGGLLGYVKDLLPFSTLSALIDPNNTSSIKVVQRLGFEFMTNTSFRGFNVAEYKKDILSEL